MVADGSSSFKQLILKWLDFSQAILVNLTTDKPESIRQGMDDLEVESLAMKLHNRFFLARKTGHKNSFHYFFCHGCYSSAMPTHLLIRL